MEDIDIKVLKYKLRFVEDEELKRLINKLIDERVDLKKSLEIDTLTGIYNRSIIENIKYYDKVVMADIDNFKGLNDTYGHSIGDKVLKLVAGEFKNNIRKDDIVCRYGGDEFLLVFNGISTNNVIKRLTEIKKKIHDSSELDINISMGISKNNSNKTLCELIDEADKALYKAKEDKNGEIVIYSKELTKSRKI